MKPKTARDLGIRQYFITKKGKKTQLDAWLVVGKDPWSVIMRFDKESDAIKYYDSLRSRIKQSPTAYYILDDGRLEDMTDEFEDRFFEPVIKEEPQPWYIRLMEAIKL